MCEQELMLTEVIRSYDLQIASAVWSPDVLTRSYFTASDDATKNVHGSQIMRYSSGRSQIAETLACLYRSKRTYFISTGI
jgi:hypothetical protein